MQLKELGGSLDVIEDIIQVRCQSADVLAVERSHECCIEPPHDLMGQIVALVLYVENSPDAAIELVVLFQQLEKLIGALVDLFRKLLEQIEEALIISDYTQSHLPIVSLER
jgi:hypothetical protein